MGLTSNVFLTVLVVIAIAAVALALRLWPRAAKPGPIPWLGRLGLIALTQVAILGVILVAANKSFGFYSSWTDLLGASEGKQVLNAGPVSERPAGLTVKGRADAGLGGARTAAGEVEHVSFHGMSSGLTADGFVYLPPQYFQKGHENDRFPVVVALAGDSGPSKNLVTGLRIPRIVSQDIAAKRIKPTIYVMVRASVVPGKDAQCTDVPGGPQTLAFFNQDLPMAISGQYRTAETPGAWGALGDTTGGYCALKFPMTNPTRYGTAAGLSAEYAARQDPGLYAGSAQLKKDNDLVWRLQHMPAPPVSLLVSGGSGPTAQFTRSAKAPTRIDTLPQNGRAAATPNGEYSAAVLWLDKQLTANLQQSQPRT